MARPRKIINQKQFEAMCAIQCTKEEICNVLEVTDKTLDKWCKEVYEQDFSVVFKQKREGGKTSLRRNQWKLAEKGNSTMQIWLGKQILKQSENPFLDQIKLKELEIKKQELEIKKQEFALKQKLLEKQINEGSSQSEVAKALREVFGANENNK